MSVVTAARPASCRRGQPAAPAYRFGGGTVLSLHSRPGSREAWDPEWHPRESFVDGGKIAVLILEHKRRHGLAWAQMAQLLGVESGYDASALTRCRYLTRERARLVLRALAGLPRPPTPHERLLAERERAARQQRARRAARRAKEVAREAHA